jgi:hypothetical protein
MNKNTITTNTELWNDKTEIRIHLIKAIAFLELLTFNEDTSPFVIEESIKTLKKALTLMYRGTRENNLGWGRQKTSSPSGKHFLK